MTSTMLIVGDVFVYRDDPPSVFRHVSDVMRNADVMIGNLEGAYADGGIPWPKGDINAWRGGAKQIAAIGAGGFHAMATTNNHIMDMGYDGLFETLDHLKRIGVKSAGAGRNLQEAHAPAVVECEDGRVALLAYTSVYAQGWNATEDRAGLAVMSAKTAYEPDHRSVENPGRYPKVRTWLVEPSRKQLRADIDAARALADIVVCSFHWGVSAGHVALAEYQVELGHLAVDCGANLVFGHHPHLLQGVEVYRDVRIFYSLGNYSFANHNANNGHELETAVISCTLDKGKITSVGFLPARGDSNLGPHILTPDAGADVVDIIAQRSAAFGTRFEPKDQLVEVFARGQ